MLGVSGRGGARWAHRGGLWLARAVRDGGMMSVSWRRLVGAGAVLAVVGGALVQVELGSAAEAAGICDRFCDGRDAGQAASDRAAVTSALYGRSFVLHVSDSDTMGWASVANGSPGD